MIPQVKQQRYALIQRELSYLLPQSLQKDPLFDLQRHIRFSARDVEIISAIDPISESNRPIRDWQYRGQSGDQFIEFNGTAKVIEDRRQRGAPLLPPVSL